MNHKRKKKKIIESFFFFKKKELNLILTRIQLQKLHFSFKCKIKSFFFQINKKALTIKTRKLMAYD